MSWAGSCSQNINKVWSPTLCQYCFSTNQSLIYLLRGAPHQNFMFKLLESGYMLNNTDHLCYILQLGLKEEVNILENPIIIQLSESGWINHNISQNVILLRTGRGRTEEISSLWPHAGVNCEGFTRSHTDTFGCVITNFYWPSTSVLQLFFLRILF